MLSIIVRENRDHSEITLLAPADHFFKHTLPVTDSRDLLATSSHFRVKSLVIGYLSNVDIGLDLVAPDECRFVRDAILDEISHS